jgi:3-hydroxybutyryl-CoA dehydrogenase
LVVAQSLLALTGWSARAFHYDPRALQERLGIAGSGAIACGLATTAAEHGEVVLWARSGDSAERASEKLNDGVDVATDLATLAQCTFVVECIVEEHDAKAELLSDLHGRLDSTAVLASTTSSLSIEELAIAAGRPERFVGFHVFNPVPKMELVELAFPPAASEDTRARARALCEKLGKTAVEVPDMPGFVVNRLLFPYLFAAVELMDSTGLSAEAVDECMTLGAGHPMGPLGLLDFVGLDVAIAIGESIDAEVPRRLRELAAEGALGRKVGRGFYSY